MTQISSNCRKFFVNIILETNHFINDEGDIELSNKMIKHKREDSSHSHTKSSLFYVIHAIRIYQNNGTKKIPTQKNSNHSPPCSPAQNTPTRPTPTTSLASNSKQYNPHQMVKAARTENPW
jgi:hypothetical protein